MLKKNFIAQQSTTTISGSGIKVVQSRRIYPIKVHSLEDVYKVTEEMEKAMLLFFMEYTPYLKGYITKGGLRLKLQEINTPIILFMTDLIYYSLPPLPDYHLTTTEQLEKLVWLRYEEKLKKVKYNLTLSDYRKEGITMYVRYEYSGI